MKTKIIVKLFLVLAFGAIFGLITQSSHEKWNRLGRDAYLAHESDWFTQKIANPTHAATQIIEWALIACVIGGAYECAVYVATTLVSRNTASRN